MLDQAVGRALAAKLGEPLPVRLITRPPLRRRPYDRHMNLPDGKTCSDCVHCHRCCSIYGHIPEDEVCDWAPSRFTPVPAALAEGPKPC